MTPLGNQTVNMTIENQVQDLVQKMTLSEKIGQMTQVEKNSITPEKVTEYAIGSVLSGGGGNPEPNSPQSWADMVKGFADAALKTRLQIPLIYGVDAVHGHNNMKGAVIFPHNIGLGATRDADLVERIGQITARECLASNVHWTFAPAVSVPQDIRWGRTFEGYSEKTALVSELARALIRGLNNPQSGDAWVLHSIKHFVADGGTMWGTKTYEDWLDTSNWQAANKNWKIDQADARIDEATLREVHLRPYVDAVASGVRNVMISFSSWNGEKNHANKYLITDVLKGELGFTGFTVSDWAAIDQLDPDFYMCVVKSINAGLDMLMVPFKYERFIETLEKAINNGDIPMERIDDAVARILRVKFELGLFENPYGDPALLAEVGSDAHRAVAREAVHKSLVLLKNEAQTLPLAKDGVSYLVSGEADDLGIHLGGWSIAWLGGRGKITEGTTILDGIKAMTDDVTFSASADFAEDARADVGVVVIGEEPYAEGLGDRGDLTLTAEQVALIDKTRARCDKLVLILLSGRPLIITDQIEKADAIIAAWLPGTESAAVADVLFGDVKFSGKLSYTWPRSMAQIPLSTLVVDEEAPLYPFGHGLEA